MTVATSDRTTSSRHVSSRPYAGLDDFLRVRQLLIDTYSLNGTYHNWETRRWEGQWYWGDIEDSIAWTKKVQLWETEDGELVGAAHPEHTSGAFLEVHPDYRHLEDEMMDWAEERLPVPDDQGRPHISVEVFDYDDERKNLLARRGYTMADGYGYLRWRAYDQPTPEATTPNGYTIRSLRSGSMEDCAGWAEVTGAVFAHVQSTAEHEARFQTAPSYRHDLHLIAEAPDGTFACFAGLTVDEANHTAVFEPVGTHPDHRRRHLAQAVMVEGMRRLAPLDVQIVYVGAGDAEPANRLYESLGFVNRHRSRTWMKAFQP